VEGEPDAAGERDLASGRGPHLLSRLGGVVDAAVAGAVRGRGRAEVVDQRAVDRREVGVRLGRGGGGGGGERPEEGHHGDEDGDGGRQGTAVPRRRGHGCSPRDERVPGEAAGGPDEPPAVRLAGGDDGNGYAGSRSTAASFERRWITALVWIWHTRLSVTLRTWPISARVRPS
jgi:hypothetical protein